MSTEPQQLIVMGGSGGIGRAMVEDLLNRFPTARICATHYRSDIPFTDSRLRWRQLDVRDAAAVQAFSTELEKVDWLLNCIGFLHGNNGGPEKSIRSLDSDFLLENIKLNTLPTLLLAKHFGPQLKKSSAPLLATISAKVGSISDNRLGGWYSYRSSKAALNMALKTLSIEWKHSHPRGCIAALHPGTNDTALSKPFQTNVAPESLFDPAYSAAMMIDLLTRLDPSQSGHFWAWDGELLTW